MFSSSVQLPLVSLFSSTGTDPLELWSVHTDASLPSDSFACLLNDATSLPAPPPPKALVSIPSLSTASGNDIEEEIGTRGYELGQTVLHLQSPSLPTTFIRCPPHGYGGGNHRRAGDLGTKLPCIHVQVRPIGREWSLEIGLVDAGGREGVVRCSTFQINMLRSLPESKQRRISAGLGFSIGKQPTLKATSSPPLLHLPLAFPHVSSRPLTSWATMTLHLPFLISQFSSHCLLRPHQSQQEGSDGDSGHDEDGDDEQPLATVPLPGSNFSHVSYVKIYATCRLRRVWFSESRMTDAYGMSGTEQGQKMPWEFLLYAAE